MPAQGMAAAGPDVELLERASRALSEGRAEEALDLCRKAADEGASLAQVDTITALALLATGKREPAQKAAARALARPDCSPACLELLGGFYERQKDWNSALECFRRGTAMAPEVIELWRRRARIEAELEQNAEAASSMERAIAAGSSLPMDYNDLATLYVKLSEFGKAAEIVRKQNALQEKVPAAQLCWLGKILLAGEKPEEALPLFRQALLMDPSLRDAFSGLAICYGKLKKVEKAKKVANFMVKRHPAFRIPSQGPAELRVLVFEQMASQMWRENRFGKQAYAMMNTIAGLPPVKIDLQHIYVDHLSAQQLLPYCYDCDVVFNNVCNGEMLVMRQDLKKLQNAVEEAGVPIVNHPDKVIGSTRENNYNHFKNDARFVFPKTRSYLVEENKLNQLCDLIRAEFPLPYILRTPTTHMGTSMFLVEKDEDLPDILRKFLGRYTYVIRYHECRFREGIFRKIRACFIGGTFHPIRMDFKADWNVHRFDDSTKLMLDDASLREEEIAYIEDCESYLGQETMACLRSINDKLGLDFLGIDFGIGDDGRMVVFEANPAMNVLEYRRMKDFPYFEAGAREVEKSLRRMLISRADARRIAPIPLA